MKVFILLALFAAANANWTPKFGKEYEQIRALCLEKEGVTGEDLVSVKKFQYPDVPSVRCYTKCMALNLGVWSNGLIADRVTSQIRLTRSKASVKPGVVKCINSNRDKPDQCTWVYREFKCMVEQGLLDEEAILKN